jgi:hypothetical protein
MEKRKKSIDKDRPDADYDTNKKVQKGLDEAAKKIDKNRKKKK